MNMLSVGLPSTLGSYLILCKAIFGENSTQTKFIQSKIAESSDGENEEVIAHETQMVYLLGNMK